ncbi:MAG: helix-turn-helix domain-containing protein [Verrucomicrobiia bacterium]
MKELETESTQTKPEIRKVKGTIMKSNPTNSSRAAPTGKKYASVPEMMQGEEINKDVRAKAEQLMSESQIAARMAQLRHQKGITQNQMAEALSVTQSAISKLEAGKDDNITLSQIKEYSRVTGERISLWFGKPYSSTEAVNHSAEALKYWLERLAEEANQNPEVQTQIKGFFGEFFYNLFKIVSSCSAKLPIDADDHIEDIRVEIVTGKKVTPTSALPAQPKCDKEPAVAV